MPSRASGGWAGSGTREWRRRSQEARFAFFRTKVCHRNRFRGRLAAVCRSLGGTAASVFEPQKLMNRALSTL